MILRRKTIRLCALITMLSVLCGCFVGCSKGGQNSGKDESDQTIVVYVPSSVVREDSERQQEISDILKSELGFNVKFITPPIASTKEKLGVMMASEEQIDVVWNWGVSFIMNMVDKQYVIPLDEYIKKSEVLNGENYLCKEYLDATKIKGNTYGIPCKMPMGYVPVINQSWLDKLNLPMPTTIDELNSTLKAFVDNKLGGSLTIGITHQYADLDQISSFLGFFGVVSGHVTINEDGERYHPFLSENGRKGLLWMQQLYKDGILDKEFPTAQESGMRQKIANGNIGMAFEWPGTSEKTNYKAEQAGKDVNMVAMEPISALNGEEACIPGHTLVSWSITSTCKNPDLAFRLIEYLLTPDAVEKVAMKEGVDYELRDGEKVLLDTASFLAHQEVAYSTIKDLSVGIPSSEKTQREMDILMKNICFSALSIENEESDRIARDKIYQCITGKMSVDDYLKDLKKRLFKYQLIDVCDI